MEAFNKAFLAKQIWKLIESSGSLVGQILKAKYFSLSGILEAKLNHNPFIIWRSFHYSIDLIKECMFWRIEDGKSVHVWGEIWLPSPSPRQVHSNVQMLDKNARVESLIDLETKMCNQPLIAQVFSFEEVESICKIPLSILGAAYKLSWWPAKKGLFFVKSAYTLEMTRVSKTLGESSNPRAKEQFWKRI